MATAGPNFPATAADDASIGVRTWTNTGNIFAKDAAYASTTAAITFTNVSHYLKATNFGFSIPSGATINGITAVYTRCGSTGAANDQNVKLVKAGTIVGTSQPLAGSWSSSGIMRDDTLGGPSNLWGTTWTDTDINDTGFGIVMNCKSSSFKTVTTPRVDSVTLTIDYTTSGGSFIATSNRRPNQAVMRSNNF